MSFNKKVAVGVLIALTLVSGGTAWAADSPVTFTWFSAMRAQDITTGIQNNDVYNEIAKRTGVTLDFSSNLNVADLNEKLSLLISADELPDLVSAVSTEGMSKLLKAKAVIPLDDLVKKYAPNLLALNKKALAVSKLLRSDDSHALYFIPDSTARGGAVDPIYLKTWYVRWDLYKKLGAPAVKTYDDLFTLFQKMVALEPKTKDGKKTYALFLPFKDQFAHSQVNFPCSTNYGLYFATWESDVDIATGKMVKRWTNDPKSPIRAEVKFLNRLAQAGLLDPQSTTIAGTDVNEQLNSGKYLGCSQGIGYGGPNEAALDALGPNHGFVPLRLTGEENPKQMDLIDTLEGGGWGSTAISKNCKDPVRLVKFLDFLASPEGAVLQRYGIEGKHWDLKNGQGVIRQAVLDGIKNDPDYYKKTGIAFAQGAIGSFSGYTSLQISSTYGMKYKGVDAYFEGNRDIVKAQLSNTQKDWLKYMKLDLPIDLFKNVPLFSYDPWACNIMSLPDDLNKKDGQVTDALDRAVPKMIFAAKTPADLDTAYADMVKEITTLGADDCDNYHRKDLDNSLKGLDDILKKM